MSSNLVRMYFVVFLCIESHQTQKKCLVTPFFAETLIFGSMSNRRRNIRSESENIQDSGAFVLFTRVNPLMKLQIMWICEFLVTNLHEYLCLFTFVNYLMLLQSTWMCKFLVTKLTRIWLFTCVNCPMSLQSIWLCEFLVTKLTWIWLFTCVNPLMMLQIMCISCHNSCMNMSFHLCELSHASSKYLNV